ncbi:MAG: hypothetical protein M3Q48_08890 [Actinomycetota bacterium]|nr:hypothetical protein [Actinomycetota bacterium]
MNEAVGESVGTVENTVASLVRSAAGEPAGEPAATRPTTGPEPGPATHSAQAGLDPAVATGPSPAGVDPVVSVGASSPIVALAQTALPEAGAVVVGPGSRRVLAEPTAVSATMSPRSAGLPSGEAPFGLPEWVMSFLARLSQVVSPPTPSSSSFPFAAVLALVGLPVAARRWRFSPAPALWPPEPFVPLLERPG